MRSGSWHDDCSQRHRSDWPGTTPITTAPSCRAASAPRTTMRRSTSRPSVSPTRISPKGEPMWKDNLARRIPKGPGGQFNLPIPFTDAVVGSSKNQKAAPRLPPLGPLPSRSSPNRRLAAGLLGRRHPDASEKDRVWDADPVLLPFRESPPFGRLAGYAAAQPQGRRHSNPDTSSPDFTPRRSRACRPRPPSDRPTKRSAKSVCVRPPLDPARSPVV